MSDNTTAAIDGLAAAVTGLGGSFDSIGAGLLVVAAALTIIRLFEVCLLVVFLVLPLKQHISPDLRFFFCYISGIVIMLLGVQWLDDYVGIGVALYFTGAVYLAWGLYQLLATMGPATGLSMFMGYITKMKGRG